MDKYKKLAMVMCSIGLMFLLTGITYSYFNYTKTGANNVLITGDIYLTLNEGNDGITLTNVFPESKEEARARNDNYITFTVNGLNESSKDIYYEIDLVYGDSVTGKTRFNDNDLVFDLIEIENNTETYLVDAGSFTDINNKKLWVDTILGNTTTEVEKTYKLRMWLSDSVIISDSDSNASYPATGANAFKKHYASVKVKVIGDFNEKLLDGAFYRLKKDADTTTLIDFSVISSSTNGEGLYLLSGTQNDAYPIYYYRGNINNNNVIFGGFCWQMLRTTDTGGIKMIYNGAVTGNGLTCENTAHVNRILENNKFERWYGTSLSDFGYMSNERYQLQNTSAGSSSIYGKNIEWDGTNYLVIDDESGVASINTSLDNNHHYTCGITGQSSCSTVRYYYSTTYYILLSSGDMIDDMIYKSTGNGSAAVKTKNANYNLNVNDSNIKSIVEDWFRTNLTNEIEMNNPNFQQFLEDTIYCNDRSFKTVGNNSFSYIFSDSGWNPNGGTFGEGPGFGVYNRQYNNWYSTTNVPSLSCPNETDRFMVSNDKAKLKYPIGLLTVDEALLAGGAGNIADNRMPPNSTYYLYTGGDYITMTPQYQSNNNVTIGTINRYGSIGYDMSGSNIGIRPVISLKLGTEFEDGGDGTPTNPYVVKYN